MKAYRINWINEFLARCNSIPFFTPDRRRQLFSVTHCAWTMKIFHALVKRDLLTRRSYLINDEDFCSVWDIVACFSTFFEHIWRDCEALTKEFLSSLFVLAIDDMHARINDTINPFFSHFCLIKHKSFDQLIEMEDSNSITFVDSTNIVWIKYLKWFTFFLHKNVQMILLEKVHVFKIQRSHQLNAMTTG